MIIITAAVNGMSKTSKNHPQTPQCTPQSMLIIKFIQHNIKVNKQNFKFTIND
jgi:hypothetical protein